MVDSPVAETLCRMATETGVREVRVSNISGAITADPPVPVTDEGRAVPNLIAAQKLPKQVGLLATPTERLQWLVDDRERMQNELSDAAHEINCSGPVAHRIRVLQQDHGQRVVRMERQIDALKAALRKAYDLADAALDWAGETGTLSEIAQTCEAALEAVLEADAEPEAMPNTPAGNAPK